MSKIVQEKFEVTGTPNHNDEQSSWVSDKSARTRHGLQTRGGMGRFEPYHGDNYNSLPPGSDIKDQEVSYQPNLAIAGSMGTGSQVTNDVTEKSLKDGFDRKKLLSTDDEYTRQHNDCFYDDMEVDGSVGYLERNNVLDRL